MYQNSTGGETMLVSEIMSNCSECTEDTPVERVYELIQKSDQGFVVVIDSESHRVPLGVVSEHSICAQIVGKGRKLRGLTAGNVIDSRIKKVPESTQAAVCREHLNGSAKAVLVVDQKGGLRGLLPPAALSSIPSAEAQQATQDLNLKKSSAIIEIPAFGWVQ